MFASTLSSLLLAGTALAATIPGFNPDGTYTPARYRDATTGDAFFLTGLNTNYPAEMGPIQALDGHLTLVENGKNDPKVQCPCSPTFGTKNYTGFWYGTGQNAGFQLYTMSLLEQQIYVDRDLFIRYTAPGVPIPPGANATSITFYVNEPLGDGLQSQASFDVQGHVTQANGTKSYYNNLQYCKPSDPSLAKANAFYLRALPVPANNQNAINIPPSPGCYADPAFTSSNSSLAAPYYYPFMVPAEPLVEFYY